jgi:SSS family solute:Na+ symporter
MILDRSNPHYQDLPGLGAVLGGRWIANISYWGCNQYITQRALGASLTTARAGILFAAAIKVLMPLIVVLPGIAVYVLHQNGHFQSEMLDATGAVKPDKSYSALINLLPTGLKGLSFAALTAAIVASLAGKANSIATIFTLDLYKRYVDPLASEETLIRVGRYAILVSSGIAVLLAPQLGRFDQAIQYIQEYTGFVSPGILAMFLLGFFWSKTTNAAAMFATVGGLVFSVILKFLPQMMDLSSLAAIGFAADNGAGLYEIPFIDRMFLVFCAVVAGMVLISLAGQHSPAEKPMVIERQLFRVERGFALGAMVICAMLVGVYGLLW